MHARLNSSLSLSQGYQKRKCWTACNYPWPEPAASAILSCISCYSPIALKAFNRKPSIQAFCNLALFRISFLADRWLFWGIFFLLSFPFSQSTLISPSCFRKGQWRSPEAEHSMQTEKGDGPAAGELAQLWGALHKRAKNQTNSLRGRSFSLPSFQVLVTSLPLLHHPDLNSVSFVCSLCRLPFSGDGA